MEASNNVLLRIEDLQTYFYLYEGVIRSVDGVTFDMRRGRTVGLIGESGCGKSVTAQSILRLVPEPPGKIIGGHIYLHRKAVDGSEGIVDITALSPTGETMRSLRWKEISMIFQEPMTSLSPVHTVGDQITEAMLLHLPGMTRKVAYQRTIELLHGVGIPQADKLVDAYSFQLSGGMRQRAMIAMALSCSPQLLIADEPTTALDVTIEAQILTLLKDLQTKYNMAMLYISHDLAVIGQVADEVVVMYLGVVVEHAEVAQVFREPLHPYTQALWRSIPTLKREIKRLVPIAGTLPAPYAAHIGCRFYDRCDQRIPGRCDTTPPDLVKAAAGHMVRCFLYTST